MLYCIVSYWVTRLSVFRKHYSSVLVLSVCRFVANNMIYTRMFSHMTATLSENGLHSLRAVIEITVVVGKNICHIL